MKSTDITNKLTAEQESKAKVISEFIMYTLQENKLARENKTSEMELIVRSVLQNLQDESFVKNFKHDSAGNKKAVFNHYTSDTLEIYNKLLTNHAMRIAFGDDAAPKGALLMMNQEIIGYQIEQEQEQDQNSLYRRQLQKIKVQFALMYNCRYGNKNDDIKLFQEQKKTLKKLLQDAEYIRKMKKSKDLDEMKKSKDLDEMTKIEKELVTHYFDKRKPDRTENDCIDANISLLANNYSDALNVKSTSFSKQHIKYAGILTLGIILMATSIILSYNVVSPILQAIFSINAPLSFVSAVFLATYQLFKYDRYWNNSDLEFAKTISKLQGVKFNKEEFWEEWKAKMAEEWNKEKSEQKVKLSNVQGHTLSKFVINIQDQQYQQIISGS